MPNTPSESRQQLSNLIYVIFNLHVSIQFLSGRTVSGRREHCVVASEKTSSGRIGTKRDRVGVCLSCSVTTKRERDPPRSHPHHVCPLLSIHPQADRRVQSGHPKKLEDILQHLHPTISDALHLFFHTFRLGCRQTQEASTLRHPIRR